MSLRGLIVFIAAIMFESELMAQEKVFPTKIGDVLVIKMTGDLAKEYVRITGSLAGREVPKGLQVSVVATVTGLDDDNRMRIEHSTEVARSGNQPRLVTLSAVVDPSKLTTRITPKGSLVARAPGGKTVVATKESTSSGLELSDLKGVKLRHWTLTEKVGD